MKRSLACSGSDPALPVLALTACGPQTYEIALVTDVGNIDDKSFNEAPGTVSKPMPKPTRNHSSTTVRLKTQQQPVSRQSNPPSTKAPRLSSARFPF
jgi:basic membrane lipoprotein Med (substrate-binding protein (PBP1-ABC) superfamily)